MNNNFRFLCYYQKIFYSVHVSICGLELNTYFQSKQVRLNRNIITAIRMFVVWAFVVVIRALFR